MAVLPHYYYTVYNTIYELAEKQNNSTLCGSSSALVSEITTFILTNETRCDTISKQHNIMYIYIYIYIYIYTYIYVLWCVGRV